MTDKVHPSAKPPTAAGERGATVTTPHKFPPNKAQLYNARRPTYRPQAPPRRTPRRGCWCRCCLWTTAAILVVAVVAAIAGAVFYLIYRPHRPSFSVNALHLSKFNLTDTSLTSNFNISVTARNPNAMITFIYDQATVKIFSGNVDVGDGSFPGFILSAKNASILRAAVASSGNAVTDVSALKSSFRRRILPLKIQVETKVMAKIGNLRTGKLGIRGVCDGIKIAVPSGKTASSATTTNMKCKLDPQVKIMQWTF